MILLSAKCPKKADLVSSPTDGEIVIYIRS